MNCKNVCLKGKKLFVILLHVECGICYERMDPVLRVFLLLMSVICLLQIINCTSTAYPQGLKGKLWCSHQAINGQCQPIVAQVRRHQFSGLYSLKKQVSLLGTCANCANSRPAVS